MLKREEVKHVAKLARIELSEKEIQKMQKELAKILDYVEQLKEVDIENLEPTTHSTLIKNVFRKDTPLIYHESEKLIEVAPQKEERFIKTKPVLK